jgi:hypothetical protein
MGLWLAQPKLEAAEKIRWKSSAGRALNRWITSGGLLVVTNRRVMFQPNRFDLVIGKKPWQCPLVSVTAVEAVERDLTVLAGGMRERLRLQTTDGAETFVVNNLKEKIVELQGLLQ